MAKIIIDTKGSDKGAETVITGACKALEKHSELSVILVGDSELIKRKCDELSATSDRIEVVEAPSEITNYDSAATAVFQKTDSSMVIALKTLSEREDADGLITAGNTGALLAGSIRYASGKNRVRPALAAILPAANGGFTCLVDTGATVDCPAATLVHFASLGSDFMKKMYAIESPKVALLSTGAERTKGNKAVKEAYELLEAKAELNFIGNVEGNNALSGDCDVLVCDGFAGNQVLKVTEGIATRIITDIVKYAKRTGNASMMELVGHLMSVYDISSLGGGIVLGAEKPIIKARGSSDEKAIVNISAMLINMANNVAVFDKNKNKI